MWIIHYDLLEWIDSPLCILSYLEIHQRRRNCGNKSSRIESNWSFHVTAVVDDDSKWRSEVEINRALWFFHRETLITSCRRAKRRKIRSEWNWELRLCVTQKISNFDFKFKIIICWKVLKVVNWFDSLAWFSKHERKVRNSFGVHEKVERNVKRKRESAYISDFLLEKVNSGLIKKKSDPMKVVFIFKRLLSTATLAGYIQFRCETEHSSVTNRRIHWKLKMFVCIDWMISWATHNFVLLFYNILIKQHDIGDEGR